MGQALQGRGAPRGEAGAPGDFYIPDLCATGPVFVMILLAELAVIKLFSMDTLLKSEAIPPPRSVAIFSSMMQPEKLACILAKPMPPPHRALLPCTYKFSKEITDRSQHIIPPP